MKSERSLSDDLGRKLSLRTKVPRQDFVLLGAGGQDVAAKNLVQREDIVVQ